MKITFFAWAHSAESPVQVWFVSDWFWGRNKCVPETPSVREERAIRQVAEKVTLFATENPILWVNHNTPRTLEELKAQLIQEGCVENEELGKFLRGEATEEKEKPAVAESEMQIELIGSKDNPAPPIGAFAVIMEFKKLLPKALIHSVDQGDFHAHCGKWDDTIYLFQTVEHLQAFIAQKQAAKTIPEACDIYVSGEGEVCFDFVGNSKREEAKAIQSVAEIQRHQAQIASIVSKDEQKFAVAVSIEAINDTTGMSQHFKVRATYTDSRGRGVIDIDPDRDINKNDIEEIHKWVNECTENMHTIRLVGPAYETDRPFFYNFSVTKFCEDQLHAEALDSMIARFTKLREKIQKPISGLR